MPRKKADNADSQCNPIGSTASADTPDVTSTAASDTLVNCAFSAILHPLDDVIPGMGHPLKEGRTMQLEALKKYK